MTIMTYPDVDILKIAQKKVARHYSEKKQLERWVLTDPNSGITAYFSSVQVKM